MDWFSKQPIIYSRLFCYNSVKYTWKLLIPGKPILKGIELDWKDPPIHRFFDKQPIIVMLHGWQEKWGPLHWLNDAHDAFMAAEIEPVNFIGVDWSGGADVSFCSSIFQLG